jgi:hypothetical protein
LTLRRNRTISEYSFRDITKTSFAARLIARNAPPTSKVVSAKPRSRGLRKEQRKGWTMLINRTRAIAAATAAALALTSLAAATPASARPYYHHHRGAGGAAVLGAVAGLFGTIATIAAREHYERHYGYGAYGPNYAPAPYGYGYGPATYQPY